MGGKGRTGKEERGQGKAEERRGGDIGGSRKLTWRGALLGPSPSLPSPPLPFPSPSLPFPLPSPSFPLPLEVGPLNPVRGFGGAL